MLEHDGNAMITEQVLCPAANNASLGAEVLKMLFHHSPASPISSDLVVAAAENKSGYEILEFLSYYSKLLLVNTEAVEAAAHNIHSGLTILNLWLKQGADLEISQLAI
jgi:hypothetical protein